MATLIIILFVLACAFGVWLNKRTKAAALEGVHFFLPCSAAEAQAAVTAQYCGGAKASARSMMSGIKVAPSGRGGFSVTSRIGDVGSIRITPDGASGCQVDTAAESLWIGYSRIHKVRGPSVFATSAIIGHRIYQLLGVSPGAARMKSFQNGLQGKLQKQLTKASAS